MRLAYLLLASLLIGESLVVASSDFAGPWRQQLKVGPFCNEAVKAGNTLKDCCLMWHLFKINLKKLPFRYQCAMQQIKILSQCNWKVNRPMRHRSVCRSKQQIPTNNIKYDVIAFWKCNLSLWVSLSAIISLKLSGNLLALKMPNGKRYLCAKIFT